MMTVAKKKKKLGEKKGLTHLTPTLEKATIKINK